MENVFSVGFVGVFEERLDDALIEAVVESWLERFEKLEQVIPNEVATVHVTSKQDLIRSEHMQFRILLGDAFAWAYLSKGAKVIETTGMPAGEEASLSLHVLLELPGLTKVISDKDERALEALERQGVLV